MAVSSVLGFALVFVLAYWSVSLALHGVHALTAKHLRRMGERVEGASAALVLLLPAVLALGVVAPLAMLSVISPDHHCDIHDHHLHLCALHGTGWWDHDWARIVVGLLGGLALVRLTRLATRAIRTRRLATMLTRAGAPLPLEQRLRVAGTSCPIMLVPSRGSFCFTTGIRLPRIFCSTGAWEALTGPERHGVIAHERAHVERHDVRWRVILEISSLLAPPVLGARMLKAWSAAAERACDRIAAREVGDAVPVARALVKLARAANVPRVAMAFCPDAHELERRIEALILPRPEGRRRARLLQWTAGGLSGATVLLVAVAWDRVHHLLESWLGLA